MKFGSIGRQGGLLALAVSLVACSGGGFGTGTGNSGSGGVPPSGGTAAGAAAAVTLSAAQPQVVADGASSVLMTATLADASGTPIAGKSLDFTTNAGTLSASRATTNSSGQAQVYLRSSKTLGTATVTASEPISGLSNSANVSFVAGAAENVALAVAPGQVAPGGTASINVQVSDSNGNPVSGTIVNLTTSNTLGQFSASQVTTDSNGRASTTYQAGTASGTDVLTAKLAGGQSNAQNLTVSSSGVSSIGSVTLSLGALTAQVSPAPFTASTAVKTAATVVVNDTSGHPLSGQIVTFSTSAGMLQSGSAVPAATVMATTDGSGRATVSQLSPTQIGNASITATSGGYSASKVITFTAGTPSTVVLSLSPTNLVPGGTASARATVLDANGNTVPNIAVTFASAETGVSGGASFGSTTVTTDANGNATTQYIAPTDPAITGDSVTARTAGGQTSNSVPVTINANNAAVTGITVTSATAQVSANGTVVLHAVVQTSNGPQAGITVNFSRTSGSLSSSSGITDSTGTANVTLTAPTQTGTVRITATAGNFTAQTTVQVIAGEPFDLAVTVASSPVVPGGTATINTQVLDAQGNPVGSGQQVNFSITTANTSGSSVTPTTAFTDANGNVSATFQAGTALGATMASETVRIVAGSASQATTIQINPNAKAVNAITLAPANTATPAGGSQTVNAIVKDSSGNPLAGQIVSFTATAGSFAPAQVTTDANGQATATYTAPSTAGSVTLSASSGGYSSSATITVGAGSASAVTVTAAPATVAPNRTSSITAVVTDAGGNGVPNHAVQFVTTAGTLANASAMTNASGVATVSFTAPATGTASITATATPENIAGTTTVTVSSMAISPGNLTLSALSNSIPADGSSQVTFQATVTDTSGTPLAGQAVNFAASAGTPPTSNVTTDNSGHANFVLTSATVPGSATVTASIAGFTKTATVTFTTGTPASVALALNPPAVSSGGMTTINATVLDANSNPVPGITVNFSVPTNKSNGTLANTSAVSDANGRASTTYTAGNALGSVADTIQAKIATTGVAPATTTLTVTNPVKTVSLISSSPQLPSSANAPAQGVVLTALVKDQNNNVVANVPVQFAASLDSSSSCGNGGALQVGTGTTDNTGTATATLYTGGDPTNQTIDISATAGGVPATLSIPETGTKLSISGPSAVGLNSTTDYTVTLTDAGNNPISGQVLSVTSALGNGVTSSSMMTDANGQIMVTYVASNGGGDTLTVKPSACATYASSVTKTIQVATQNLTIIAPNANSQIPFAAGGTFSIGAAVASGGSGYELGDVLTVQGGTPVTRAQLTVSQVSNGAITAVTVTNAGDYTALPASPAAVIGGSGNGATFTVSQNITVQLIGGTVSGKMIAFNATRGTLSSSTALTDAAGVASVSITQPSAAGNSGGAVVTASCTDCSPQISASVAVQFNATTPATVKLQANPATVAINGTSTITASLRDANDNLVANQLVQFTLTDDSGGGLLQSSGITDSSGRTTVTYQAGSTASSLNGVKITATNSSIGAGSPTYSVDSAAVASGGGGSGYAVGDVLTVTGGSSTTPAQLKVVAVTSGAITAVTVINGGTYTMLPGNPVSVTGGAGTGATFNLSALKNGTVSLTVGGQGLRIVLGTGNTITALNSTQYQLPYSVLVTDPAGNPPPAGSVVNLVVNAISYQKGTEIYNGTLWVPVYAVDCSSDQGCSRPASFGCANEDVNLNGIFDPGEDYNGNGILDPGNVTSAPASVTLDANGTGQFNVTYPKDRAYWVDVFLTATIKVNGDQGATTVNFVLPGLSSDFTSQAVAPPGQTSPYGTATSCADPN